MQKLNVLLIDDDLDYCKNFKDFTNAIFMVEYEINGLKALTKLEKFSPDIIFLDYWLQQRDTGLDILKKIRKKNSQIPVIMISEKTSVEVAVEAMKLGAYHYTAKYGSVRELLAIANQEIKRLKERLIWQRQLDEKYARLLGDSPVIKKMKEKINKIAMANSNVLITGETGVGKELVAWEIHKQSKRHNGPFVAINSSAIPENLFESELFGHKKGAFTGAYQDHLGRFELADKGDLFLDEISTVPLYLQAKLLRVLDTKTVQRVGDEREIFVDVRIIAATNEKLEKLVRESNFREDLYHRLNILTIHVPPLRERKEDIPLIANHYYRNYCVDSKKDIQELASAQLDILRKYHWPGNIRELKNLIERYVVLEDDTILEQLQANNSGLKNRDLDFSENLLNLPYQQARSQMLQEFRQFYFKSIINRFSGNISQAAEWMGVPRTTIYRALKSNSDLNEE